MWKRDEKRKGIIVCVGERGIEEKRKGELCVGGKRKERRDDYVHEREGWRRKEWTAVRGREKKREKG